MAETVLVPTNLTIYKPTNKYYSIGWRINLHYTTSNNFLFIDDKTLFDCDVQVDVVNTFDSVNLKTYNKYSPEVVNYQDGYLFKSYVFEEKSTVEDVTYYCRVRVNSPTYISDWSEISSFDLSKIKWNHDTYLVLGVAADKNTYTKEGVTNVSKVFEAYMRMLEDWKKEKDLINSNVKLSQISDESLYDDLGVLMSYVRDSQRPIYEYRGELLDLWQSYLNTGTEFALNNFIFSLFGTYPVYESLDDRYGWIVHDSQVVNPLSYTNYSIDPYQHYFLNDPNYPELDNYAPEHNSNTFKGNALIMNIYNTYDMPDRMEWVRFVVENLKPVNAVIYIRYLRPSTQTWGGNTYWGCAWYWGQNGGWSQYTP